MLEWSLPYTQKFTKVSNFYIQYSKLFQEKYPVLFSSYNFL